MNEAEKEAALLAVRSNAGLDLMTEINERLKNIERILIILDSNGMPATRFVSPE